MVRRNRNWDVYFFQTGKAQDNSPPETGKSSEISLLHGSILLSRLSELLNILYNILCNILSKSYVSCKTIHANKNWMEFKGGVHF